MTSGKIRVRVGYKWIITLLFTFAISLLNANEARAQSDGCVSTYGGVIDGNVNPVPPAHMQIDGDCTIRNFPASRPFTSNVSFYGNNPTSWLVIFDNVVFTGNMSCSLQSQGNFIWFTNGSTNTLKDSCVNLFVPTEKIIKQNPAGQTTATIGVPFTYKLTIPVLFDPVTGTVINSSGSPNELRDITVWDDLNATGADLSYVSYEAYWLINGTRGSALTPAFSNVGGFLTFSNIPVVPAGQQFVIEITVVLNDTLGNVPGKQFVNTAKWQFGRLIGGTFHEPLPGEWGVSPPLTIAAPVLTVTKSGPATMNLGQWGNFAIDIRNTGTSDAWNASIRDLLPVGATGGMCDRTPEILSAQVYSSDGVTPVAGKGPLNQGSDYSLSYSASPTCRLDITMLTAAGRIGANERLIIRYRTQLDANTQNGVTLTNVAGAIQWFNGDSSNPNRKPFIRTLTNGTPGVADHEDAHDVTTAFSGYFFTKTVVDLTSGANPATTAAPGDTLRYTLRVRTPGQALSNFRVFDEMDARNDPPDFAPGTLKLVTYPAGAEISATSSTGGAKGTGVVYIDNLSLPANGEAVIQFDITLKSGLSNGTIVTNQATLHHPDGTAFLYSDDPNVNGTADPNINGDEDPTRVTIASASAFRVQKISTDRTGDPNVLLAGETLRYTITVKNIGNGNAVNVVLRDAAPANTTYVAGSTTLNGVAVADVAGVSPVVNGMRINSPADPTPGLMPADASSNPANVATITFDVVVNSNVAGGTVISNQGLVSGTGFADLPSDDPRTPAANDPTRDTVANSVSPALVVTKSGPATMNLGQWGDFTIDLRNTGTGDAWNASIRDLLPVGATGGMCDRTPEILSAQVFAADGVTAAPGKGPLSAGSDYSLSYSAAPSCRIDMTMLTASGRIGANERLIIHYRTQLDANTQNNAALTNVAGAIQWFDGDSNNVNRKSSTRTLTNGTPGTPDHEDAHTVTAALSGYLFEKTVADLTSGANPATTAKPGDTLRYTLRFRTTNQTLSDFRIFDELDALNAQADFAPGTLTLVASPAGADISATSSTGGVKGTGVIDVRSLNIPANGDISIQFDITLKSALPNNTVVLNQATLRLTNGTTFATSDDPNVNGAADPNVSGDEDPTRVTIASSTAFRVQKISTDLTGDPNVLLAGEKLRYTITVKNISNADAVNVALRDAVPANTTYVAGSTTLNGVAVADVAGLSPLVNGMLINSPGSASGSMPADASSSTANVATITFDVVVNSTVVSGTVISNQGFVSGTGFTDLPSDDPRTPAVNDPTRDTVANSVSPALVVTKSGPATMNLGQWGDFTIDLRNTGTGDAWNASIRDLLPVGATGGMCDRTPEILSAQVFAADGVTAAPGKGPLSAGSDYSLSYSAAPSCRIDMTMLTASGRIGANERLIIHYRTQLDANTQNNAALTNVAGAIQWFDGDSNNVNRKSSTRTLTNGTPGTPDHEDAHTVTAALSGYLFEKTVADLTSGANPATTAKPGDTLRYTLRFRTTNQTLSDFRIFDELDALNAQADFAPGTLTLVASPAGADISATSSTGGVKGTGVIDVRSLNIPANGDISIQFDITLKSALPNNTVVLNQATLRLTNGTTFATSDDPNVNGAADPNVSGDEDPTRVTIASSTAFRVQKISTDLTGDPNVLLAGEKLRYTITVKNISNADAVNVALRDAVPANTTYVAGSTTLNGAAVADVAGLSPLVNGMLINSPGSASGSMPADASSSTANVATITFDVVVNSTVVSGTVISNQGFVSGTGFTDLPSDDPRTPAVNDPTLNTVTNVPTQGPVLMVTKSGPATMNRSQWGNFTIDVRNTGLTDAWSVTLRDLLPVGATGGMCDLNPEILSAQVFTSDGVTPAPSKGPLSQGSDYSVSYSAAPSCRLDITTLTAAARIGQNERLIIRYRTQLDANTQSGATLTNVAGAIQWFDGDTNNLNRKSFTRTLTNGTPSIPDHEDAHDVTVALWGYFFDKTVADLTSGANPAKTAAPGDKLRYTLRFRTTNQSLSAFRIFDELDALNAQPAFVPGSLTLVTSPAGADISGTTSTGGVKGTGILQVRNLNVPVNGEVIIQFDITLASTLTNGTVVANQSMLGPIDIINFPYILAAGGTTQLLSDDPNVNGTADPAVAGDEDPTRLTIVSGPSSFRVQKISTDLTGDPNVLLAGDTLRYTITVKNISYINAVNVMLRDATPANTTYVAGSTTLNTVAVADVGGASPLVNGMKINPPGSGTPGSMLGDPSSNTANVATITFDVVVNSSVANGTVISNQGFVSGTGFTDQPSDDPRTPNPNDPTRDIVGNTGYFFEKTVADLTSGANPATTAAPADKLRYTLRFRATNQALSNFRILDELDALNPQAAFAPGTLTLVASPAGADISATSSTGGAKGTGVVDIRNLNLPVNGEVQIQFDITLKSAIANNTVVANQATLRLANGTTFATSDDPNVNGAADPNISGDEDPTRVTIASSSAFRVQKISSDRTGDPNVLLAGETLRYTITVKNISNADAFNVTLHDAAPADTTYVANSTTLNGAAVADVAGASPLASGMKINPTGSATVGLMPADASSSTANVATITFDVVVNSNVANGTVISNQGVVSGTGFTDQPSDDPRTPAPNDPTRDIVGNKPKLYAEKRVALFADLGSPGIVDPGDVLRYTITVTNSAAIPATGVVLTDPVPANTTYVANSTLLNGSPFGQPDGGSSPLASSINIGTIAAGATATIQFDLRVNPGTASGTVISNQAVVSSPGLPNLPTDGDGNPATGPEPTVVVVGNGQTISISKQVSVVGGGAAVPGAQLEYVVTVVNSETVPALNVVISDDLNASQPGQLSYVNQSATINGSASGVSFAGSTITYNYGAVNGALAPGAVVELRFRAMLATTLTAGMTVTNTGVVTWNNPPQTASASAPIVVAGGVPPSFAALNGSAWHDANFDDVRNSGERALEGWTVELYRDTQMSQSVLTDANGDYHILNVAPNDTTGVRYELRFHAPGAGANTALLGRGVSPFTNGIQRISNIVVQSGADLQGLNLAIHPNGVIYNSQARTPIAGATLTLLDARSASSLPAACFDDAAQQGQITLADGYYKFDVNFSDPACPSGGDYVIGVTAPSGTNYVAGYSQIIPPTSSASTVAFSVPACPSSAVDAIPGTAQFCEVQPSEFAPNTSVAARSAGTTYHVHLLLDGSQIPGTSQIFNNHIPIDPVITGALTISKTTPALNVTRGQLVPYVITVNNIAGMMLADLSIVDRLPAGFSYVAGSAVLDGVPTEPSVASQTISWNRVTIAGKQTRTLKLLVAAGAGVSEGEFVNHAQVMNTVTGSALSGDATATVRLVPEPNFDCTDVTGKVFNDANRNGLQDDGEKGLAGVRVVTARGLAATTDQYGRYHITCAITPNESRGSNFVLKLDDRTLPSGFRMATDKMKIQRATRGKTLQINFAASIHRVISIDLLDEAFEPGKTEIREQWKPRLNLLLVELRKAPSVLRLAYVADMEDEALVKRRVEAIKRQLTAAWDAAESGYLLTIEQEVFWRRGAPVKRPPPNEVRRPER